MIRTFLFRIYPADGNATPCAYRFPLPEGQKVTAYYISRKPELLKNYDKSAKSLEKVLTARFDDNRTNTILIEIRQEFETLIPKIPYIEGEKNLNPNRFLQLMFHQWVGCI